MDANILNQCINQKLRKMKVSKTIMYTIAIIIIVLFVVSLIVLNNIPQKKTTPVFEPDTIPHQTNVDVPLPEQFEPFNDWNVFMESIAMIESTNDTLVVNEKAVGYLQITPIYVREVNRILAMSGSDKRYTLEDRTSKRKSIEMFHIHQNYHNPDKDKIKCLRQHRGKYSESYNKAVLDEYQSRIIKNCSLVDKLTVKN